MSDDGLSTRFNKTLFRCGTMKSSLIEVGDEEECLDEMIKFYRPRAGFLKKPSAKDSKAFCIR